MPELNAKNDEKLIRLGYVAEVPKDTVLKECGQCSAKFIGEGERNGHAKERHVERFLSPADEDDREIQRDQMLETVAPLYMDQTAASRESALPAQVVTEIPNRRARAAR
jgi:hypothetical protein